MKILFLVAFIVFISSYNLIAEINYTERVEANQAEYQIISITNTPHYISQNFIDTYEQKSNLDLRNAIFDIVNLPEDEFLMDDLVYLASKRLANEQYNTRSEFRQLLLDSVRSISVQADEKFINLGVSMLEVCKSEIQRRYISEDWENDQTLESESDYLFSMFREISNNSNINIALRAKALHYLGKKYTVENSSIVIQALSDADNNIVKSAGRALCNYFNYITENEKQTYIPEIIQTIEDHKNIDIIKLLEIRPVINSLGMVKKTDAQSYLVDLLGQSNNAEVSKQILFSLSYKATKERIRFILSNLNYLKFDTTGSDKELFFAGIILESDSAFTELKNENDDNSQIQYLTGLRISHKEVDNAEIERIKGLLNNANADVRLEAVKTLHYLLPYSEQHEVFSEHKLSENDEVIKWEIEKYIGL